MEDAADPDTEFSEREFQLMRSRDRIDDTHMTSDERTALWERYRREWENNLWWQAQPSWPPWPFRRGRPPHP